MGACATKPKVLGGEAPPPEPVKEVTTKDVVVDEADNKVAGGDDKAKDQKEINKDDTTENKETQKQKATEEKLPEAKPSETIEKSDTTPAENTPLPDVITTTPENTTEAEKMVVQADAKPDERKNEEAQVISSEVKAEA